MIFPVGVIAGIIIFVPQKLTLKILLYETIEGIFEIGGGGMKGKFDAVLQILLDRAGIAMQALPDVLKPKLRQLLYAQFKKSVIDSIVQLIICVFAMYMAIFKPFGELYSLWISSFLFIGMLLWSIVEFVSKYYMFLIKCMQKRSMRLGIIEFIKWKFPNADTGSSVYDMACDIGSRFSSRFRNLRSSDEIIWEFVIYLAKDIVTFISIFSLYILLVHWIFKPIILENFAGLTTMQIYLFPIRRFL